MVIQEQIVSCILTVVNLIFPTLCMYFCLNICSFIHSLSHSLQGSAVEVTTMNDDGKQYNDGKWHDVVAVRHEASGWITVDGQYTGKSLMYVHGSVDMLMLPSFWISLLSLHTVSPKFHLRWPLGASKKNLATIFSSVLGGVSGK